MPTYQYRCTDCGHDLEAVQKFTDAALTECPNCGGSLRKIFNAVGVVFKGSGFYRTDSRADGRSGEKKAGADGADGASSDAPKKEKADSGATAGGTSGGTSGTSTKNGESGKTSESKPAKQPAKSTSSTAGNA